MTFSPSFTRYYGLPNGAAQAYYVCKNLLENNRPVLFISAQDLDDFDHAAQAFLGTDTSLLPFPATDTGQMRFLHQLLSRKSGPVLITAPYEALHTPLPDVKDFQARTRIFRRGDTLRRQELLDMLENAGYTRDDYAETPGQYAARGSVVDIFCLHLLNPLRLYFSGNRLDSISAFDVDTHHTQSAVEEALILPLCFEQKPCTLADFVPNARFIFDEPPADFNLNNYPGCSVTAVLPGTGGTDCHLKANLAFGGNTNLLAQEIKRLTQRHIRIFITCLNRGELNRLTELLEDPVFKQAQFIISPLTRGFIDEKNRVSYISSNEILNRRFSTTRVLKHFDVENAKRVRFKELQEGDYVVHRDYGIGRYLGLEVMNETENPTDCLMIEYRRGSKLYVPMYDFKKVQKYISAGGKRPTLAVLGGTSWKEVKKRVTEQAQKAAQEILKLEAKRQAAGAPLIVGDARLEQEFADSFPHILTPGQEQAIQDTLHDLDLPKPMDRVLVGDVGFGKTEVAMRAALKVALSGKQVMVLVPTTILADQHYKTFTKRMAGFPLNVRMLCRFQTQKEQKAILAELKSGLCDIIIGTHRLLSKDIGFKELGLVIIDEEHRFGVKQKEKIRALSIGVHCLMLSATPIPRTLNQSLSSLRDISLIDTPPRGRTPIKTVVTAWNDELAAAAINQELARNGQVYYVYNTVRDMEERLAFLRKLVPQAHICMAHGQMNEKELEQTLWDFNQGKYDVLLASTIIESGIDITNANTLIVEDAQNFGLAQLYQLRGRIGRGDQKAYCYLFHPTWLFTKAPQEDNSYADLAAVYLKKSPQKDPTAQAKERLSALMEFGELGSGFRLALRDMEIRGAGELLGVKQHGYVNEVGLTLYCDLVASEVRKLKGQPAQRKLQAKVNLPLPTFIPPDYLPDEAERLKTYKELMSADTAQTQAVLARLTDQCGPLPPEITHLVEVIELSNQAGNLGIYQADWTHPGLELNFTKHAALPADLPEKLLFKYGPENVQFLQSKNGHGLRLACTAQTDPILFTRQTLAFLNGLFNAQK